jgi:hypothetical protein
VPDARQHATNLAVSAFGQHHFQNRAGALLLFDRYPLYLGFPLSQIDAPFQLLQLLRCWATDALHEVAFLNAELGMS